MSENQVTLVTILRQVISDYESKLDKIKSVNDSALSMNRDLIEKFRKDINTILEIDISLVEKILDEVEASALERDTICKYLKIIKTLLTLNKENNTTFKIQDNQLRYVELFFEKVDELSRKNEEIQKANMKNIGKLTSTVNKYKQLLRTLEDRNNTNFISDIDVIMQLFKECETDEKTKQEILLNLMKYNLEIYQKDMEKNIVPSQKANIKEEDIKDLFQLYHYNFEDLNDQLQEDLLEHGNAKKIKEILDCLMKYKFPMIDLKSEGKKLVLLLLKGEAEIIANIAKYSRQKGINSSKLLGILPALIAQNKEKKKNNSQGQLSITGRSDDYIANIEFLEKIGFSIPYIYDKCKNILIMPNSKLIENYKTFIDYGFQLEKDTEGKLTHPALSSFLANNFQEALDQFIEVCPRGKEYIENNLSRLRMITNTDNLIMYNIYASYMHEDEYGFSLYPEGPFVLNNGRKPMLRGEITRYIGSGYENIPYRGIEEHNKKRKTNTIDFTMKNKERFDQAIELYKKEDVKNLDFPDDEIIQSLDSYIQENDPIKYNFDGVIISRLKVKRIYNILKHYNLDTLEDSLLYAITYNSIMDEESFNKIKTILKGRRK